MSGFRDLETDISRVIRMANSTAAFVLSFVLLTYLGFWSMALAAKFFKISSVVYYYGIKFILNDKIWTRFNIIFIFASPVVLQLLWAFLSLFLFDKFENRHTIWTLFLIWNYALGIIFASSHFISAVLGFAEYNSPFYHTIAVVFAWFNVPKGFAITALIGASIAMVYLSITTIRPFLRMAFSFTKLNKLSRKRRYYLEIAFAPAIAGWLFCMYYSFPMNFYITALVGLLIFIVQAINIYALNFTQITIDEVLRYQFLQKLSFPLILVTSLILIAIFFIRTGVNF